MINELGSQVGTSLLWILGVLATSSIGYNETANAFPSTIKVGHIFCDVPEGYAAIALNESVKRLKSDQVVPAAVNFKFIHLKGCDDISALNATLWLNKDGGANVIIGPEDASAMSTAALIASLRNTPIIGYASGIDELSNKTKYTTLIRTSFNMGSLAEAIGTLIRTFNWSHVAVIRSNMTECEDGLSGVYSIFKKQNITLKTEIIAVTTGEIDDALDTVRLSARIILLCYGNHPSTADVFLRRAYDKDMVNSEFVYIIPYYTGVDLEGVQSRVPCHECNITTQSANDEQLMQQIHRRVLTIQATGEQTGIQEEFQRTIEEQGAMQFNTSTKLTGKESLYLQMLHDSLYIYGKALAQAVSPAVEYNVGTAIFDSARRLGRFDGVTGSITMNNASDRYGDYDVWTVGHNDTYERILTIEGSVDNVTRELTQVVQQQRRDLSAALPADTPACGLAGENCPKQYMMQIIIGLVTCFGITVTAAIFILYYRKQKHESDVLKMVWKISLSEVKFLATGSSISNSLRSVGKTSLATDSVESYVPVDKLPGTDFKAVASVRAIPACAKCWQRIKPGTVSLDRCHMLLLKQLKELRHDNINAFLGAMLDDEQTVMVFWKHCAKGSLHDLVMNEDINLDMVFTVSIVNDIVSGLDYLHNRSSLRYHGNLSITNCLVDSRWLVKLTDFGWYQVHESLVERGYLQSRVVNAQRLYHYAPEALRLTNIDMEAPQLRAISIPSTDTYALAIIMYQVLFRIEPYSDGSVEDTTILSQIRQGGAEPIRPTIPKRKSSMANLVTIMQSCWEERPTRRPTIKEIKRMMHSYYGKTLKRSLMDHVMSLLERYATNLEKVVEERTQQLELERKRADQLLYQMLPKSVAEMLKTGQTVDPETYECVTIYFSDIVGFTELSSVSTPVQIVAMLNSLYSAFDETIQMHDVYKVETIGDAYMVVSGLPRRNGLKHVFEICDMALSLAQVVQKFEIAHRPEERLLIRIGIHSGPVAAGVVGLTMPRFCLFGDTVNTASRMESTGKPSRIHISQRTRDFLVQSPIYIVDYRGRIEMKGKGICTTYWLVGKSETSSGMYQREYKREKSEHADADMPAACYQAVYNCTSA